MRRTVSVLNATALENLADELLEYAKNLPQKIEQFLRLLADKGIEVARQNEGDFKGYITYTKDYDSEGYALRMIAKDNQPITREWFVSASPRAEIRSDTFSPLLMAEFGSGAYQLDEYGIGRLPDSMGHGSDPNGWYWWSDVFTDGEAKTWKNGRWLFHSYGTPPTMPMHKAVMAMIEDVEAVARSVFG